MQTSLQHTRWIWLICLCFVVSSCGTEGVSDDYLIEYWSSNNGGEIEFSQSMVQAWNAANPGSQVKYQPVPEGQSSEEIILAAVVGKTTPDIYSNIWQGTVPFYSEAGILVPLDTIEGFLEFLHSRCSPETIEEITAADGHIYQVPWKINPFMTIYNERIFEDLDLDAPPQTYPEYLAEAEKFRRDTDGDGYVDQWFGYTSVKQEWYQRLFNFYPLYLAASGGMPLIENNRANFNNRYGIGVFDFLQELYNKRYFSRERQSAGQDLFVAERYATKFTGPWEIQYLERFAASGFRYSFYPMPVPSDHSGPIYTYCDPKSMVIFNTCENPKVAFEFIRTMTDEKGDLFFLETTYQLPRRKELDRSPTFMEFFEANEKMRIFAEQARHIRGVDQSPVLTEVFDIISQEYEACVLYAIKSPAEAIADAEAAVNVLLRAQE
jgi:multiple sugar transport system substrate-binding protein